MEEVDTSVFGKTVKVESSPTTEAIHVKRKPSVPLSWELIVNDLNRMRKNGILCDVQLAGCDYAETRVHFKGHSALLAASGKVFYKLFAQGSKLAPTEMFQIYNTDTVTLKLILDFIYGVVPDDLCSNAVKQAVMKKAAELLEISSVQEYLKSLPVVPHADNAIVESVLGNVLTHVPLSNLPLASSAVDNPIVEENKVEIVSPSGKLKGSNLVRIAPSKSANNFDVFDVGLSMSIKSAMSNSKPNLGPGKSASVGAPRKKRQPKKYTISCMKCPKNFEDVTELTNHLKKHHSMELNPNTVISKCKLCNKLFWHKDALVCHLKSCAKKPFKCTKLCSPALFSIYNCEHCSNIYITEAALQTHMENNHQEHLTSVDGGKDNVEKNECDSETLGEVIANGNDNVEAVVKDDEDLDVSDGEIATDRYLLEKRSCADCALIFDTRYQLSTHLWYYHKTKSRCVLDSDGNFTCSVCSQSFPTRLKLNNHYGHHHQKPQKCSLCVSKFDSPFDLLVHMHHEHPGYEYYICCICGKKCTNIHSILRHFKNLHNIEATYPQLRGLKVVINPMNLKKVEPLFNAVEESSATEICEWGGMWLMKHYTCPHCHNAHSTSEELTADVERHLIEEGALLSQLDQRPHECQLCGMLFVLQSELRRHLVASHEEYMTCQQCKAKFADYVKFTRHVRAHMLGDHRHQPTATKLKLLGTSCGPYKCLTCSKGFQTEAFKFLSHNMKEHDQKWMMCSLCGHMTSTATYMVSHFAKHGVDVHYPILRALKLAITASNIKNITPLHTAFINIKGESVPDWVSNWLKTTFLCTYCNMSFHTQEQLIKHIRVHLEQDSEMLSMIDPKMHECDYCSETFNNPTELSKHRFNSHDIGYPCDICGKKFHAALNLQMHRRLHSENRPYVCRHCGKSFKQSAHLGDHVLTHSDARNYSCEICGRQFKIRATLRQHMRRLHNPDYVKKFECKICGSHFHTISALHIHHAKHCDDRPHSCIECGKTFKTFRCLRKHMQGHGMELYEATAPPIGRPQTMIQVPDTEIENYNPNDPRMPEPCQTIHLRELTGMKQLTMEIECATTNAEQDNVV